MYSSISYYTIVLISVIIIQCYNAAPTDNQYYNNPLIIVPGSLPSHFLPFQDDLSAAPSSYHINHGEGGASYSRITGAAHEQQAYPFAAASGHIQYVPQPIYNKPIVQLPLPAAHQAYPVFTNGQGSYAAPSIAHYVGDNKGHEYKKGGGSEHHAAHHGEHGNKGHKGHTSKSGYEKGESGKHDKENHSGHYAEDGGNKKGEHEEKAHHASHEEGQKGEKGGSHGEKGHHKKGSSTKGYHNVYHKDEYKKEHSFYDDEHKEGFKKHYGSEDEHHSHKKGGHEKGGHHNSGHHEDAYGKKGSYDKGHHHEDAKGHKGESGHEDYHEDHEEYGKKGGEESGSEHGYAKKGGHY